MTADELIERLQELDKGLHMEVLIEADGYAVPSGDFDVVLGWDGDTFPELGPPPKVVIYIHVNEWD